MPATDKYTLADMAKRTKAKTRALQAWTDGGVILSTTDTDRAGRGVHRLYYEWEVLIAAILTPLASRGVPIGHLKHLAALLRPMVINAISVVPAVIGVSPESREISKALARAIKGEGENYLCFDWGSDYQWIGVKMDEGGPACICPSKDFPLPLQSRKDANTFLVVDITSLLHGVTD